MSLNQLKVAQVQSSLNVSGGGGGGSGITGLVGNASGSVVTTVAQPTVAGAGSVTVSSSTSGLLITGTTDGVGSLLGTGGGSVATTASQPTVAGAGTVTVTSTTAGLTITGVAGAGSRYASGTSTGATRTGSVTPAGAVSVPLFNIASALTSGAFYSVKCSLGSSTFTVGTGLSGTAFTLTPFVGASAAEALPATGSVTLVNGASGAVTTRYNAPTASWLGTYSMPWALTTERTLFQASDTTLYVNMKVEVLSGTVEPNEINWTAISCPYQIIITQVTSV